MTIDRRDFLRAGLAAGAFVPLLWNGTERTIALVVDPADSVATAPPSTWALGELRRVLTADGYAVQQVDHIDKASAGDLCVVAAGATTSFAVAILKQARVSIESGPERLALVPSRINGRPVVLAAGSDPRGLTYALLELADRLYIETERYRLPCLVGGVAGKPRRDVAAEHQQIMDATLRRSEDAVRYLAEHYQRTSSFIEASIDWPALAQAGRQAK